MKKWFLCLCLAWAGFNSGSCDEKVLIITSAYNRPDFVKWQYKTFRKLLKDDFEYVVFNDAKDDKLRKEIKHTCRKYGIRCFNVPKNIHYRPYLKKNPPGDHDNGSVRNATVVQYALDTVGYDFDGIVAIFDSDMFLVRETSFNDMLEGYEAAGTIHTRWGDDGKKVPYLWIGLALANMNKLDDRHLFNFNLGLVEGVMTDAGGYTYYYLRNNPPVYTMPSIGPPYFFCPICESDQVCEHFDECMRNSKLDDKQKNMIKRGINNMDFLDDGRFLHYGGGSNWDQRSKDYHKQKTKVVKEYMEDILERPL
ncbi:MAG: hypothetical protein S4CHLAM102_06390 [Chlamydiia bacterium]|nr:hypothetical protein [Chlamydiia bacterium]